MDWRRRIDRTLSGSNQVAVVLVVAALVAWHAFGGYFPPTVDALLLTALAGALIFDSLPGGGKSTPN